MPHKKGEIAIWLRPNIQQALTSESPVNRNFVSLAVESGILGLDHCAYNPHHHVAVKMGNRAILANLCCSEPFRVGSLAEGGDCQQQDHSDTGRHSVFTSPAIGIIVYSSAFEKQLSGRADRPGCGASYQNHVTMSCCTKDPIWNKT